MIRRLFLVFMGANFLLGIGVAVPVAQEGSTGALRVQGAAVAADQVQKWATEFGKANPKVSVVVTGSSAGKGFQALFSKEADIALASRVINESEQKTASDKGLKLSDKLIGYAGVAVYTSPRNPVNELSFDQLKKMFTGKFTNWKEVGGPDEPIRCFSRRIPESSGAVFFWEKVLGKEAFGPNVVMADSFSTIIKTCATAKDLPIGIGPPPLTGSGSGAKILAIKETDTSQAVRPDDENLKNGSYPIILPFYMYWNLQSTDPRIIEFVDYCAKQGCGGK